MGADTKVIDVALKYGYESPESFTRAFTKFHGITPSEAKKDGSKLKSFSRLSVKISLSGGNIMDYKIIEKEAFDIIEKVETHTVDNSENAKSIPDFWTRSHKDGTVKMLTELTTDITFIFGVCYGNLSKDAKTFDYSIAAKCDSNTAIPKGFRKNTIPARTWAVFECIAGRIGEHNATKLLITPPAQMQENGDIGFYYVAFETGGKVYHSDRIEKANTIEVSLWKQLTENRSLAVQLEACSTDESVLEKSILLTGLCFLPSACGEETESCEGTQAITRGIEVVNTSYGYATDIIIYGMLPSNLIEANNYFKKITLVDVTSLPFRF